MLSRKSVWASCSSGLRLSRSIFHPGLFLGLLLWPALPHAQAILANELVEPRSFGYAVGDKIRREVHLSLDPDYRLDETSLPKPGRLDRWLEVAAPEVHSASSRDGRRYDIILTYQIFNAPSRPETVTIPQHDLRILGSTHPLTTLVPALRIGVVPVTSGVADGRVSDRSLQQDRPPPAVPVETRQTRLAWTGAALLALLLYSAWRYGLRALLARRHLPFTKAWRDLKHLQPSAPAQYAAGLKMVHDAINRTAGRAVFAHNLDEFLLAHPAYDGLRTDLERLFAASCSVFFADAAESPLPEAWSELLRLCRACSRIERQSRENRPRVKFHAARN